MEAENKDLELIIRGVSYKGNGFSCSCGYHVFTRKEMEAHRAHCPYTPEVYMLRRAEENNRYQKACERGYLDV